MENVEGRVCVIAEPRMLKSGFSESEREVLCERCVSVPCFPEPFQSMFCRDHNLLGHVPLTFKRGDLV
jgi:hypothetical protein